MQLCRTLLTGPRPFWPLDKVSHSFQLTLAGMENRLLPRWKSGRIKCVQTQDRSSNLVTNLLTYAYQTGTGLRMTRQYQKILTTGETRPVCHSIGLSLANMVDFIERVTLGSKSLSTSVISVDLISRLNKFVHRATHELVRNDKNQSLDQLLNRGSSDSLFFGAMVILIKSSLRPVLESLNTWVYEGLWTTVLDDLIVFKSRYQIQRNKTYWTHQYTRAEHISPIFVQSISLLWRDFQKCRSRIRPNKVVE